MLGWKTSGTESKTFNMAVGRTDYYQKYTVTKNVQTWEARTGWNVYGQWQNYTYYTTDAPAPMYARVRVCDTTEEIPSRDDLCVRYPGRQLQARRRDPALRHRACAWRPSATSRTTPSPPTAACCGHP